MKIAFYIIILYAGGGFLYYPSGYSLFSFIFILISCLPFYYSENFSRCQVISIYRKINPIIFWIIFLLGIFNLNLIAKSVDATFVDIFSFSGIRSIAIESTARRYSATTESHSGNPVILALNLWLVFRIGTIDYKIKGIKVLLSFIPIIMYTVLTTEKWLTFLGVVFFLTGLIITYDHKEAIKILKSKIKYIGIILIIIVLSIMMRGFQGGIEKISFRILHYVFPQYNSLGLWFFNEFDSHMYLGKYTFIGPLNFIGLVNRNSGIFDQNLSYYGDSTNIYTAFRYIIEDFSMLGPIFLNSIISFSYILFAFMRSRFTGVIKVFVLFCAFLSLNTTPFVHNTVMLGVFLAIGSEFLAKHHWDYK